MNDGQFIDASGLCRRIAAGDEAAFSQLVELFAPRLQAMAARITGSVAVADDLVQDTFLKVWLSRDQLSDVAQPAAWIKKICFYRAVNHVRRQSIHDHVIDAVGLQKENTVKTAEIVEFRQLLTMVNTAVQQLPEKQRQVYRLSREQALSISEIAEHMDLAVSTVKNLMVMALKSIRTSLQKSGYPLFVLLLLDFLY
ncbi:RNA polymerase sigma factor [Chitinophaga pinensis]|uniref:RNA polymerase sigma factor n=1 Tax=Chitinophaga pinensis (strain ATCC 43595 / DSM 2588 / LMG 13176 / NBRC 15968 / NCIMB 11800 / UQM 2034) TaxID=485918 RepID=A0A979GPD6_CHIPD|nr:sigma-70 family RNA polymerase sigma factor [Chitinophaga pinensis]ACU60427.1 RNA polymerase, sigma-24 subunit, ECF subfamily [Chitinophaga pinensis DSM 2588]